IREAQADYFSGAVIGYANARLDRTRPLLESGEEMAISQFRLARTASPSGKVQLSEARRDSSKHPGSLARAALVRMGMSATMEEARNILQNKIDPRTVSRFKDVEKEVLEHFFPDSD